MAAHMTPCKQQTADTVTMYTGLIWLPQKNFVQWRMKAVLWWYTWEVKRKKFYLKCGCGLAEILDLDW